MCKSILHNDTLSALSVACYDFTFPFFQGGDKNEGSELGHSWAGFPALPLCSWLTFSTPQLRFLELVGDANNYIMVI